LAPKLKRLSMISNYDETDASKTFEVDYKMMVMDLDNPLLRDDHSISSRNKQLLTEAQNKGVKVVLASGRPT